jgi:hypothetical protein
MDGCRQPPPFGHDDDVDDDGGPTRFVPPGRTRTLRYIMHDGRAPPESERLVGSRPNAASPCASWKFHVMSLTPPMNVRLTGSRLFLT